ncbi:MAG: PEP-CTERM sorting domain-containing protein [Tepidisphaeraceae bacterium]
MLKKLAVLGVAAVTVCAGLGTKAYAGPVYWTTPSGTVGNFSYSDGQSDKGLYGNPTVTSSGTTADFKFLTPHDFEAEASNGTAETTSDRLSFNVALTGGGVIDNITIHEFGDWSILGGTATVKATGALFLTNGSSSAVSIVPTVRYTNTDTGVTTTTKPNGESDGVWVEDYVYDLPAGVTSLTVVLNNILQAASTSGTTAFIQKKGVDIIINDPTLVPEPASLAVFLVGGSLIVRRRRA